MVRLGGNDNEERDPVTFQNLIVSSSFFTLHDDFSTHTYSYFLQCDTVGRLDLIVFFCCGSPQVRIMEESGILTSKVVC